MTDEVKPKPLYYGQDISKMSTEELTTASFALNDMLETLNQKRANPKFIKKMQKQPAPTINPAFTELINAINNEIASRKSNEGNTL